MKNRILVGTMIAILAVIIAICLFFVTNQSTTTYGENPDPVESRSLACEKNNSKYAYFAESSDMTRTNINILFSENTIGSIALIYKVYYSDKSIIEHSEAVNHAAMNKSFSSNGLDPDALDAIYTKSSEYLQFNIYTTSNNLNQTTQKYFLLDNFNDEFSFEKIKNFYTNNGFICQ